MYNSHRIIRVSASGDPSPRQSIASSFAAPALQQPGIVEDLVPARGGAYDDDEYNEPHINIGRPPGRSFTSSSVQPIILRAQRQQQHQWQPVNSSGGFNADYAPPTVTSVQPLPIADDSFSNLNSRCVVPSQEAHPLRNVLGAPPPTLEAPAVGYQRSRMFLRRYMDPSPHRPDDDDLSPVADRTAFAVTNISSEPPPNLRLSEPKDVLSTSRQERSVQTPRSFEVQGAALQSEAAPMGVSREVPLLASRSTSTSPTRRGLPDPQTFRTSQISASHTTSRPQPRSASTSPARVGPVPTAGPTALQPAASIDATGSSPPRTPALSATRLYNGSSQIRQVDTAPLAEPHRADSPPHSSGSHPERAREQLSERSPRSTSAPVQQLQSHQSNVSIWPQRDDEVNLTSPVIHPQNTVRNSLSPRDRSQIVSRDQEQVVPMRRSSSLPHSSFTAHASQQQPAFAIPTELAPKMIPRVSTVLTPSAANSLPHSKSIVVPTRTASTIPPSRAAEENRTDPISTSVSPSVVPRGIPRATSSAAISERLSLAQPPPSSLIPRSRSAASLERSASAVHAVGYDDVKGTRSAPELREAIALPPKSLPRSSSVPLDGSPRSLATLTPPGPLTAPVATAPPSLVSVPSAVPKRVAVVPGDAIGAAEAPPVARPIPVVNASPALKVPASHPRPEQDHQAPGPANEGISSASQSFKIPATVSIPRSRSTVQPAGDQTHARGSISEAPSQASPAPAATREGSIYRPPSSKPLRSSSVVSGNGAVSDVHPASEPLPAPQVHPAPVSAGVVIIPQDMHRPPSSKPLRSASVDNAASPAQQNSVVVPKGLPRSNSRGPEHSRTHVVAFVNPPVSIPRSRSNVAAEQGSFGKSLSIPARPVVHQQSSLNDATAVQAVPAPATSGNNSVATAPSSVARVGRPTEPRVSPIISFAGGSGGGSNFRSMAPPPKITGRRVSLPSDNSLVKNFSSSFGPVVADE